MIKIGWFFSMFFDFCIKTPVSNILYACLSSDSTIWLDSRKESLKTQVIYQPSQIFVVSHSHAVSTAVHSNHFLWFEWLFDAKVPLNGHAVTQNYVSVVFQSQATENNSHE